jgi:hypothetical protein
MARITGHSAFPLKKEMVIGIGVWLTYAVPAVMLYMHPKPTVANVCWTIVAAMTVLVVLPILVRLWLNWPRAHERAIAPSPE